MDKLERDFQAKLIIDLRHLFPGCFVLKGNSAVQQGIPDLLVLYKDKWAMLECKKSATAKKQPNQQIFVDMLDDMSFSAFVYPANKGEILDKLQQAFGTGREARRS